MNPFTQSAELILGVAFGIYILAVLLRFILQWARADFYNPLSQFVVKITNPLLIPLRRVIPGWGGVDFAAVVLMVALKVIELLLISTLQGLSFSPLLLVLTALSSLIGLAVMTLIIIIFISAILSWLGPHSPNPMVSLLHQIADPVLRPFRRLVPNLGGIDISPIVAIISLQIFKIFADWSLNMLAVSLQ